MINGDGCLFETSPILFYISQLFAWLLLFKSASPEESPYLNLLGCFAIFYGGIV